MAHHLRLDKEGRELGTKGSFGFPVVGGGRPVEIADYEGGRFECHFHPETELTVIVSGEMYYQAGDAVFTLSEGDAVFVNAEVLHAGWQKDGGSCRYRTLNFAPVMVSGHEGSRIEERYVTPMLRENRLPFAVWRVSVPADAPMLARIDALYRILQQRTAGYELLVKAELCLFWRELVLAAGEDPTPPVQNKNAEAVKRAIAHIETHFAEELTLDDLATVCGLSRSAFCRTFRKYTGRTPFSYLRHLRVRRSLPLLADPARSITEVAAAVGFSGSGFYAETFRHFFGMSPREYRKRKLL